MQWRGVRRNDGEVCFDLKWSVLATSRAVLCGGCDVQCFESEKRCGPGLDRTGGEKWIAVFRRGMESRDGLYCNGAEKWNAMLWDGIEIRNVLSWFGLVWLRDVT